MQQLSTEVQSLINASYHINTYAAAVAELVYNSLDANSTSIAIRINVHDSNVQVVDNGYGIKRSDFDLLGQRFTTSKFGSVSDLKPSLYGNRGLALATIIEVCNEVTITSHYQNSQETYTKLFCKGKSKGISRSTPRPSKGTTVDIRGFLYNLKLQRNAIEGTNELHAIKGFLEQLSLLCLSVSFSLRDDAINEILFKINKNRDLYTTLLSLFDIKSSDFQELQVEKKDYKVKAFICKRNVLSKNYQWIYLNNKFIHKSKIHTIMNTNLMKSLGINKRKISKRLNLQEPEISNQDLPFYFLFVSCPTTDYDININAKLTTVAFKNWDQITNLLEKLVQCYSGEIKLTEICNKKGTNHLEAKYDTKEEVKKIMEKILVNNMKKQKTLQMHNGAKGKSIKRKKINVKKVTQKNKIQVSTKSPLFKEKKSFKKRLLSNLHQKTPQLDNYDKQCKMSQIPSPTHKRKNHNMKKKFKTPLMNKFIDPSKSLIKKCEMLSQAARKYLPKFTKKCYSPPINKGQNEANVPSIMQYDIKQKELDIFNAKSNLERQHFKYGETAVISSYDLVNTILNNAPWKNYDNYFKHNDKNYDETKMCVPEPIELSSNDKTIIPTKLTYESHAYDVPNRKNRNRHYISYASRMNFQESRVSHHNVRTNNKLKKSCKFNKSTILRTLKLDANESLHTIDVSSRFNKFNYQSNVCDTLWDVSDVHKTVSNITNKLEDNFNAGCGSYSIDQEIFNQNTNTNINFGWDLTYSIHLTRNSVSMPSDSKLEDLNRNIENNLIVNSDSINVPTHISNISNSLEHNDKNNSIFYSQNIEKVEEEIEPLYMCETLFSDISEGVYENFEPKATLTKNDSLLIGSFNDNDCMGVIRKENVTPNVTSHHFHSLLTQEINDIFLDTFNADNCKPNAIVSNDVKGKNDNNLDAFTIERRCNFMPKGMSPIIKNCNMKTLNSIEDDYYDDTIYKKFAASVLETAQIFEQNVQSVNELITNDTHKVNNKMKKDNADLIFNSESLNLGKVLGQVDKKFIATIIPGHAVANEKCSNFLVLFDQHAVHERIRLENNLSDYFDGTSWKTQKIDPISFKIPKDDIVFLHNYKDRLSTFGLQWSFNDNSISVYEIPKAILGKATRQVDVILKAVKSLIAELIESLRFLKGNIPQYPQTIMNLVFSEACRYAIMFGDPLSKAKCVELLQSLSQCKTPFQCAHGRPVMAVIMEVDDNKHEYKMNLAKIKRFINANN